ncbi:radial spoke head 10 homolog B [Ischnura elegans]|uniref:radial spoke head 10 homolog B n=1 Tax=Ischnura elegans TaxID=197161 RepID=UPI001ED8752D|nr:radial spoke head 10 homolog B [Ischnura elegans]
MDEEDVIDEEHGEDDSKIGAYEGERNEFNERDGQGRAILPNKDLYQGSYKYGKRHGKGLYVFRNGARYGGDWYKNLKDGKGVFYYPDGSKYEGDWQSDMKHGYGVYIYPNGDIYEGTWKENLRHGLGTYLYKATGTKFIGIWMNGIREGPGQLLQPKNRFYGTWEKDMPLGPGCYVFDPPVDCMIHGEYVLSKDPALASVGDVEEGEEDDSQVKKGIIPVWHSDHVTSFDPTLLPPIPVPMEISDIREKIKPLVERDSEVVNTIVDFEAITNECLEKYHEEIGEDEEELQIIDLRTSAAEERISGEFTGEGEQQEHTDKQRTSMRRSRASGEFIGEGGQQEQANEKRTSMRGSRASGEFIGEGGQQKQTNKQRTSIRGSRVSGELIGEGEQQGRTNKQRASTRGKRLSDRGEDTASSFDNSKSLIDTNTDGETQDESEFSKVENTISEDTSPAEDTLLSSEMNNDDETTLTTEPNTITTEPNTARSIEDLPDDSL